MHATNDIVDVNDIESRLIILKRRAAEADFLREERDMLLNRLMLYSNEYILPESKAEVLSQEFEALKRENETLNTKNAELAQTIISLETHLSELESIKGQNEKLKESLMKMSSLESDLKESTMEKEALREDLDSVLKVLGSEDPNVTCKNHVKRLLVRSNELNKEKKHLQELVVEKSVRINVLLGKISLLESRLNQKYLSVKLKVKQGKALDGDEALLWTVYKLETANKTMGEDLRQLTEQFESITEKYNELLEQMKKQELQTEDYASIPSEDMDDATGEELHDTLDDTPEEEDKGSTAPCSISSSMQSLMLELPIEMTAGPKLAAIAASSAAINKYHRKLLRVKNTIQTRESARRVTEMLGGGIRSFSIFETLRQEQEEPDRNMY